jgi:uncharacterized short protein YbdD (DUF466 family)
MRTNGRLDGWTAGRLENFLSDLKRICGMPDYPGYLQHMAERHPGSAVQTEREFFEAHVNARYGSGASRCC